MDDILLVWILKSTLVDNFKALTILRTPLTAFVLHLHFCWNENNDISPELSEIRLGTLVNAHLADVSLHSLQELLSLRKRNN